VKSIGNGRYENHLENDLKNEFASATSNGSQSERLPPHQARHHLPHLSVHLLSTKRSSLTTGTSIMVITSHLPYPASINVSQVSSVRSASQPSESQVPLLPHAGSKKQISISTRHVTIPKSTLHQKPLLDPAHLNLRLPLAVTISTTIPSYMSKSGISYVYETHGLISLDAVV
jgi:hypothetical protein